MTDLGKGDVVVAISDMSVGPVWTAAGRGSYEIKAGARAIVAEVTGTAGFCTACGHKPASFAALKLEEYPLRPHVAWCPCEWRKIGPSKEETAARFAGHLNVARPRTRVRA